MRQAECVDFLRWAMPRLGLDWAGFKHCHRQVCKRLGRRAAELGLTDFAAYRAYALDHDSEWSQIDASCRVTVSRFYRDRAVFDRLAADVLPHLAAEAAKRSASCVRAWSAGCGAGEEPYSLALTWQFLIAPHFPRIGLHVVATDIDETQLSRAEAACYRPSALRDLPTVWAHDAFVSAGPLRCLRPEYRAGVHFRRQDIRADAPRGPFDLVLCRNLAFTYFDSVQRREALAVLLRELAPDGYLVIGRRESLPPEAPGIHPWSPDLRIFSREPAPSFRARAAG